MKRMVTKLKGSGMRVNCMLFWQGFTPFLRLTFSMKFYLFVTFFKFLHFYGLILDLLPHSGLFISIKSILIYGDIEVDC